MKNPLKLQSRAPHLSQPELRPWNPRVPKQHYHVKAVDFWTDDELCLLYTTILEMWDSRDFKERQKAFFVLFMINTGARLDETVHVDLELCGPDKIRLVRTKNGKARDIEWFPEFYPFYSEYVNEMLNREEYWMFPRRELGKIRTSWGPRVVGFTRRKGPMCCKTADTWWNDVISRVEIKRLTSHVGGRKTFATWAAEVMRPADLQDQLGHADYQVTDKIYRGSIPGRRFNKTVPNWRVFLCRGDETLIRKVRSQYAQYAILA